MSNVSHVIIPERPGAGRLGRHIEHDERSRAFEVPRAPLPLRSVTWERHCPAFDQGDLGSCTANAICGLLMTGPFFRADRILTEDDAVRLYEAATRLDRIPGHYPPDDTGSSGLAAAKAAHQAGYLDAYHHAFSLTAALHALALAPIIIGINWYDSFDAPEGDGAELLIADGATVRGCHEVCLDLLDVESGLVGGINSWGTSWGADGRFCMTFATFGRLLKENGDAIAPVPPG